ncbi:MAG: phosphate acyltransferase PlsX [Proteobacteria bacterium SW_6_67_9]|jgi:glycerol-3-phosphate acyltransferase PlsX|nr:MAG: phosphate acyltransferase PlsX [Proteobacteria bacterium SW_6_67_9]
MSAPQPITVALDAMGGDHGASVVVPAALRALTRHEQLHLILVGDRAVVEGALPAHDIRRQRIRVHHASQTVAMDEAPAQALRSKKDSSMRVALRLVKEGQAQACVSAGNTGALMATARYVLKTLPGIERPAIITAIPAQQGHTHMLDLGANVDCTAAHLAQFASMGSTLASAVDGLEHPRVGLLNVGAEQIKGNEQVKEADQLLAQTDVNYIGYVEGDDICGDRADVIVCDGFVGNVALKTTEGVAKVISQYLRQEFKRNLLNRLIALVAIPVMSRLKKRIDPRRYNGASLLGLNGIAIKSHGNADEVSFTNAIDIAVLEVQHNVPTLINQQLEQGRPEGLPA